jgi:short-subunit dehydrogenase
MISAVKNEFPEKSVQILVNNAGHGKPLPLIDHSSLNDRATIEV